MNRYIAYLDILGFADLVNDEPLDSVLARIRRAMDTFNMTCKGFPAITIAMHGGKANNVRPPKFFSFSDTFIVVSDDDSLESLVAVSISAAFWTRLLFVQSLPVRGAITFGEASYIDGSDHLIGKAIIRAHEVERSQDWLGVVVDEEFIPKPSRVIFDHPFLSPLFVRWNVPIKGGSVMKDALAVNWRLHLKAHHGIRKLFREPKNEAARSKIEASLVFAKHIRDNGLDNHVIKGDNGKIIRPWYLLPCLVTDVPADRTNHGDIY